MGGGARRARALLGWAQRGRPPSAKEGLENETSAAPFHGGRGGRETTGQTLLQLSGCTHQPLRAAPRPEVGPRCPPQPRAHLGGGADLQSRRCPPPPGFRCAAPRGHKGAGVACPGDAVRWKGCGAAPLLRAGPSRLLPGCFCVPDFRTLYVHVNSFPAPPHAHSATAPGLAGTAKAGHALPRSTPGAFSKETDNSRFASCVVQSRSTRLTTSYQKCQGRLFFCRVC